MEGSVRRFGRKLRITLQLINVSDGYHLWSERYDRKVKDVFAIQDEIAGTVANKLKSQLTSPQLPGRTCRTRSLEAYDAYLRGRYDLNKFTDESVKRAIVHFEEAIANDSDYALAYAGLAESYLMIYGHAVLPGKDVVPKAIAAA